MNTNADVAAAAAVAVAVDGTFLRKDHEIWKMTMMMMTCHHFLTLQEVVEVEVGE